jgi:hypothetical protein
VPDPEFLKTNLDFGKDDICFIIVQTIKEKQKLKKMLQEKFGSSNHIEILFNEKSH